VFGGAAFPTVCVEQVISGVAQLREATDEMRADQLINDLINKYHPSHDISIDSYQVQDDIIENIISGAECCKDLVEQHNAAREALVASYEEMKDTLHDRCQSYATIELSMQYVV
jgi:hypothetical protein